MTIIIGRILFSIMNKPVKFKTKPIAPSFNSVFSFFLNHLRITDICKYTNYKTKMDMIYVLDIYKINSEIKSSINQSINKGTKCKTILNKFHGWY